MTSDTLLSLRHLSKTFNGVRVLTDATLELQAGEIHGLVGQNGSGKSTLIKCLSGYHSPDPGWELRAGGTFVTRALHPGDPARLGISFVHQDLGVIGDMTVLENLLLNRFAKDRSPYIGWRKERREAKELLSSFDLDLDPRAKLGSLRPVEQAQVAIIRALMQFRASSSDARRTSGVLVLDEATTFLDQAGRESLHTLLRSVAAAGSAVLFVSHDIAEILGLADRVTVLRDGLVVETAASADLTHDDVIGLIVGGDRKVRLDDLRSDVPVQADSGVELPLLDRDRPRHALTMLEVVGLDGPHIRQVSFKAARGEILGITGIVGSGWEFILEHLYGAAPAWDGRLHLGEQTFEIEAMKPKRALELGMVMVPSERLIQGIIPELTLEENVMLPVLDRAFYRGRLRRKELRLRCEEVLRLHAVSPPEPGRPIGTLSGGNQQKAVLGKWLQLRPAVVLLNEPTQGVDVGARQLIFGLIREAANQGAIVLYASGDWAEVSRVSDRVVVVADGRLAETLAGDDVTPDRIAAASYRGTRRSADMAKGSEMWSGVRQ